MRSAQLHYQSRPYQQPPPHRQGWSGQGQGQYRGHQSGGGGCGQLDPVISSMVDTFHLYDFVATRLAVGDFRPNVIDSIMRLHSALKVHGRELERHCSHFIDHYQNVFKEACKDGDLDLVARLQLVEIVELRSSWKRNSPGFNKGPKDNKGFSGRHLCSWWMQTEGCNDIHGYSEDNVGETLSLANYLSKATASLTSLIMGGSGGGQGNYVHDDTDGDKCFRQLQFPQVVAGTKKVGKGEEDAPRKTAPQLIRYDRKTLLSIGHSIKKIDSEWLDKWEGVKREVDFPSCMIPSQPLDPLSSRIPRPEDLRPHPPSSYVIQRYRKLPQGQYYQHDSLRMNNNNHHYHGGIHGLGGAGDPAFDARRVATTSKQENISGGGGGDDGFSSFRPNANIPMRMWDEEAEKWVENF